MSIKIKRLACEAIIDQYPCPVCGIPNAQVAKAFQVITIHETKPERK